MPKVWLEMIFLSLTFRWATAPLALNGYRRVLQTLEVFFGRYEAFYRMSALSEHIGRDNRLSETLSIGRDVGVSG